MSNSKRSCVLIATILILLIIPVTLYAAGDEVSISIEKLKNFLFNIVQAIGVILVIWGVVQLGLSLQSHDPSQRSQGFFTLAGGIIIACVKSVMQVLGII
jgi:hypothetical protein